MRGLSNTGSYQSGAWRRYVPLNVKLFRVSRMCECASFPWVVWDKSTQMLWDPRRVKCVWGKEWSTASDLEHGLLSFTVQLGSRAGSTGGGTPNFLTFFLRHFRRWLYSIIRRLKLCVTSVDLLLSRLQRSGSTGAPWKPARAQRSLPPHLHSARLFVTPRSCDRELQTRCVCDGNCRWIGHYT